MNYKANMKIVKQTSLSTMLIKKQNLHLMCANKYLQHFNLNVHHKSEKQHIILNILSKLVLIMSSDTEEEDELNVLFVKIYAEMSDKFQKQLVKNYDEDFV